jgi:hypothetical protein
MTPVWCCVDWSPPGTNPEDPSRTHPTVDRLSEAVHQDVILNAAGRLLSAEMLNGRRRSCRVRESVRAERSESDCYRTRAREFHQALDPHAQGPPSTSSPTRATMCSRAFAATHVVATPRPEDKYDPTNVFHSQRHHRSHLTQPSCRKVRPLPSVGTVAGRPARRRRWERSFDRPPRQLLGSDLGRNCVRTTVVCRRSRQGC